ncbi:MAG: PAS domain S-box protein, partial [Deltaproteobacteria bacterium]|nr:PAS domain S-box protein [Deltaproteobacteria bacterium]
MDKLEAASPSSDSPSGADVPEDELKSLRERVEKLKKQAREAEQAVADLKRTAAEFRAVMEAAASPILLLDLTGRVTFVNAAFTRVFGWEAREAVGKRLDFVPKESLRETKDALNRLLSGEKVANMETKRKTRDGKVLDVEMNASIYTDTAGQPLGSVLIFHDVTQQKKTERELRDAAARGDAVMAACPDPIVVFDSEERVLYTNPAFTGLFGWTK